MNIEDKLVISSFLVIFLSTVIVIVVMNHFLGNSIIPGETKVVVNFGKIVDVNKKDLFKTMEDIQNYPKILPNNYLAVRIINQTDNITYAEEEVMENGIKAKLVVRHTIIPYSSHTLEVLEGDASGTKISEAFDSVGSSTLVITNATLHFHGILVPFGFLAQNNFEHAFDTALYAFVKYTKDQTRKSQS